MTIVNVYAVKGDYRGWKGRRATITVNARPNRTEKWFRVVYGIRFYARDGKG